MENSFFGREDRGLLDRLIPELPGILNWARQGYLRLAERGYVVQPESARDAIAELEALGSPISTFIKERCAVDGGLTCQPSALFEAWRDWCAANGRKEPGTLQSFGRDLRAAVPGLRVSRPRISGDPVRHYEGIALASASRLSPRPHFDDEF